MLTGCCASSYLACSSSCGSAGLPPFLYCAHVPAQLPVITGLGCTCTAGCCSETETRSHSAGTPQGSSSVHQAAAGCGCCGPAPDNGTCASPGCYQQEGTRVPTGTARQQPNMQQPQGTDNDHSLGGNNRTSSGSLPKHGLMGAGQSIAAPASATVAQHGPGPPVELRAGTNAIRHPARSGDAQSGGAAISNGSASTGHGLRAQHSTRLHGELRRECGPACSCNPFNCPRRTTQQGVGAHVRVVQTEGKVR
jgi:hypothetical protein